MVSILGFFLYPETKGVRFEKLDELYALGIPPRHFKKHDKASDVDNQIGAKQVKDMNVVCVKNAEPEVKEV